MKKKIDSNMPIGKLKPAADFLPPPSALGFCDNTIKVTISLSLASVEFFKRQAKVNHTRYQKMIRDLLDQYASRYSV